MKPLDLIKATYDHLEKKAEYLSHDVKSLQADLNAKLDELEAADKLLDEYHEFIKKSEAAEDAISGSNTGLQQQPATEDVRQPGTEPSLPL